MYNWTLKGEYFQAGEVTELLDKCKTFCENHKHPQFVVQDVVVSCTESGWDANIYYMERSVKNTTKK